MLAVLAALFLPLTLAAADDRQMLAALAAGDIGAMRAALEAGADPDGASPFIGPGARHFPVFIAAKAGRADILALLVEFGADVDRRDGQGLRPLDEAAAEPGPDTARLLLDAGAAPDPRDPAEAGARWPLVIAAERSRVETALLLLDRGADPDPTGVRWGAPLHHAAAAGEVELAARLLAMNASVARRERMTYETPLHNAAGRSTPEMVRLLIEAGAPLDARDWNGETPLFRAARSGRHEIVSILVEAGAATDIRDDEGRSPLVAMMTNRPNPDHLEGIDDPFVSTRERILEEWARWPRERDFDAVARLLASRTFDLDTALAEAVWGGWEEAARILVARGALVHGRTLDGKATLAGSFLYPGLSMFDRLVEANVSLSLAGAETIVAAAAAGRMDIARALFARRWRVDTPDRFGRTALMAAAAEGRVATVTELLALGADPAVTDAQGDGIADHMKAKLAGLIGIALQRECSRAYKPTHHIRETAARLVAAYEEMLPALGLAAHAGTLMPAAEERAC